jgi:hypothetical protein
MASTYVNDLRLNEMATGDGSGTWGTTTNTNLELIAEAFSYGTEVITTNADTHTTTIADGATDPGRALYLKYTGTLDSACTITIGPDTVSKVWIIENGTSGSQNIIISQGSGANITIPAGDTKVVYSDGAGAGAAFFDAFASLSVVDLKVQDDLTVTDDASIGGDATITGTLGVTGNITGTLATAAQTNITSVGTLTGFTSTGIDDNADATAITIDSSENVGIGTAAPESIVHIKDTGNVSTTLQIEGAATGYAPVINFDGIVGANADYLLGEINGSWDTHTNVVSAIRFESATDTTNKDDGLISFWTSSSGPTLAERMSIDSSGNVGIGTSSPRVRFQVTPASNDGLPSLGTASAGSVFTSSNGLYGLNISVDPAGLTWMQAMRFDGVAEAYDIVLQASGGNVGIGTSSFSSNYRMSVLCATGTGGIIIKNASTTGVPLLCVNTAGSEIGSISTTNTATAYNTSSDYRLKEDDVPMTGATERVKALRPINFAWKVEGSRVDGFLAHEVQEIVPEAITKTKDAMRDEEYEVTPAVKEVRDEDGNVTTEAVAAVMGTRSVPDYQGIDQSKLVPLLTAALQEAITKIEDLTTRLETLENA